MDEDPPYQFIRRQMAAGRVIPFLGSGASLGVRPAPPTWTIAERGYPPTAGELAGHLAHEMGLQDRVPELPLIAQYFDAVNGGGALVRELSEIFARPYPIPPLHQMLARAADPLLVVTTNYDDIMERAFGARKYHLVIHRPADQSGKVLWRRIGDSRARIVAGESLDIDFDHDTVLYKVHGSVSPGGRASPQYLVTDGDYLEFLSRMTAHSVVPDAFARPFKNRHFLFLGYSLRDWNIRVILRQLHGGFGGRRKNLGDWAITATTSSLEWRFWSERGVSLYEMTIEDFLGELEPP
jgi:hypothetical protein